MRQRFGHRLKRAAKSDRSGKYSPCRFFAPSLCLALRSAAPSGTEIVTRRYTPLFRPRKARPYKSRRVHHDNARLSAAGKKREVMRLLFSFCPLRFCSLLSRCARRDTDRVTLARLGTAVPRRILTALAIPSLGKMPRSLQVPPGAP